jgi:hypothetical protein
MKMAKTFSRFTFLIGLALLVVGASTAWIDTQDLFAPESAILSGVVGLVPGQTARLNATNAGDGIHPPDPCKVTLMILGGQGQLLAGPTSQLLEPGASVSLDLALLAPGPAPIKRTQVRGFVKIEGKDYSISNPIAATLQILDDSTGSTAVLYPLGRFFLPTAVSPPQQFGLVGILPGQTVRLNLVNLGPNLYPNDSCNVEVVFLDKQGSTLATFPLEEPLAPGAATSFDLNASTFFDRRTEIQALVTTSCPGQNSSPNPTLATLEVFDNLTSRTTVIQYPNGPLLGFTGPASSPLGFGPIQMRYSDK